MADEQTLVEIVRYPRLMVRVGGQVVEEVPIQDEVGIGRGADNDVRLNDPRVSRYHALVKFDGKASTLTDLGSANGTWLGDSRLANPHKLRTGEKFAIGSAELTYEAPADAPAKRTVTVPVAAIQPKHLPPLPESNAAPRKSPDRISRGLIIGVVIVATLLIIAVAAFVVFQIANQGEEPVVPTVQATPAPTAEAEAAATSVSPGTPMSEATATKLPSPEASPLPVGEFDAFLMQAGTLTSRSKFEEAIGIYEELVEREPANALPEVGWAEALIYDDEPAQAQAHAEIAVELDPSNAEAAAVLSRVYAKSGDGAQALAWGEKAVQLDPDSAPALAALAEAYLLDGKKLDAVARADMALESDPANAEARRIRGWLYYLANEDAGKAVGELQQAAGLQPELWLRFHEIGLVLLDIRNNETALASFEEALSKRPEAATHSAMGQAYYGLEQYSQAVSSLQKALAAGAQDAHTYAVMAATYSQMNRCDDAKTYSELALALDPNQSLALDAVENCTGARPTPAPGVTPPAPGASSGAASGAAAKTSSGPISPSSVNGRISFPVWNAQTSLYDTYLANADGSNRRLVVSDMHQPVLDSSGGWLAVNGERRDHMNLFVVRPDGTDLKEITTHVEDGQPNWSATGGELVFASTRHGDKKYRIYVIDDVPFAGTKVEGRVLNYGPDDVRGQMPAWTQDGRILYRGCHPESPKNGCSGMGLYIMPSDPGPQTTVQLTEHPEDTAPAAYGGQIAFMSNRDGNWEIYTMGDDGAGLKRLTDNLFADGLPVWSPDGRIVAFVSNEGGTWAVWAMNADGSNRSKLFDIGEGGLASDWQHQRISWSP